MKKASNRFGVSYKESSVYDSKKKTKRKYSVTNPNFFNEPAQLLTPIRRANVKNVNSVIKLADTYSARKNNVPGLEAKFKIWNMQRAEHLRPLFFPSLSQLVRQQLSILREENIQRQLSKISFNKRPLELPWKSSKTVKEEAENMTENLKSSFATRHIAGRRMLLIDKYYLENDYEDVLNSCFFDDDRTYIEQFKHASKSELKEELGRLEDLLGSSVANIDTKEKNSTGR